MTVVMYRTTVRYGLRGHLAVEMAFGQKKEKAKNSEHARLLMEPLQELCVGLLINDVTSSSRNFLGESNFPLTYWHFKQVRYR
jgi:hypothetical protein